MSNPNELSGRPLATPIHHQHQQQQPQQQHSSTSARRRRRDSQSSDERLDPAKPASSRRRPGTRKQPRNSSSLVDSPTMQRSVSPSSHAIQDSVHYTRTGRISKAKKGLKVHNCECGRSYTRAEHLRRHQKNHAQDALQCDFPGCGKPFYRIDLLQRHQERHNEPEATSPQASDYSPESTGEAEVPVSAPVAPMTTPTISSTPHAPYYHPSASPMPEPASDSSVKHQPSFPARQAPAVPVAVDALQTSNIGWTDPFSQSPNYSSSSGYASPIPHQGDYANMFANPPYGPGAMRTRTSSNASYNEPQPWTFPSRSPTSATSTMAAYAWNSNDKSPAPTHMPYMNTSYPMTTMPMTAGVDTMAYGNYGPKTLAQRDQEEQEFLFPEQSYGMGQIANTYPYDQYLSNYWRHFHPHFPVIHRASFERIAPTPMLHAAAIAIGGQYSSDPIVKRRSRILHDRCMKLLGQREFSVMTEVDRTCDWQALFLVEVLSQYRARRAAKSLSSRFETVYRHLCQNSRAVTSSIADILSDVTQPENATFELWTQWVELSIQQRLLLGCYILECEQVTLLARSSQQPLTQLSGFDLPFPSHTALWDATNVASWAMEAQQQIHSPIYVYQVTSDLAPPTTFDIFQSSLLITAHYNPFAQPQCVTIDHLLSDSATTKHQLLTSKLVQCTPVRPLLAVSGETWILSEKVTSPQIFESYKATLRSWVSGLWSDPTSAQDESVKDALKLAMEILQNAFAAHNQDLRLELGPDMGLYYAALVVWAVTVAATTHLPSGQPPLQYPLHPSLSAPHAFSPSSDHLGIDATESTPNPAHPNTLFALPEQLTSQISPTPNTSMMHSETTMTVLSFLDIALMDMNILGMVPHWPRDIAQWQQGCGVLMQWVKMRLRNAPLEGLDNVAALPNSGPASAAMGCGGDGYGEVLDGIIGVLDKLAEKGWDIWGI